MVAVILPFLLLTLLSGPVRLPVLIFLYPVLLILVMILITRRSIGRSGTTRAFVTDRRILVDQPSKETSSSMALENVGRVEINVGGRAARRAGVAWVYVLPMGVAKAMVGGGRARHAAPGVLWIPAVPIDTANEFRNLVIMSAQNLQARLGYPPQSRAQ